MQALDGSPSASDGSVTPSTGPAAQWWPSLCLELGSLLQVNPDILRRQLVCELFSQGLDLRAEQVILLPGLFFFKTVPSCLMLCAVSPRRCWKWKIRTCWAPSSWF